MPKQRARGTCAHSPDGAPGAESAHDHLVMCGAHGTCGCSKGLSDDAEQGLMQNMATSSALIPVVRVGVPAASVRVLRCNARSLSASTTAVRNWPQVFAVVRLRSSRGTHRRGTHPETLHAARRTRFVASRRLDSAPTLLRLYSVLPTPPAGLCPEHVGPAARRIRHNSWRHTPHAARRAPPPHMPLGPR